MWRQVLSWVASIAMAICMRMIRTVLMQEGGGGGALLQAEGLQRGEADQAEDEGDRRAEGGRRGAEGVRAPPYEAPRPLLQRTSRPTPSQRGAPSRTAWDGKTLLAKAVAAEARVPLLSLHAATLESVVRGRSEDAAGGLLARKGGALPVRGLL